VRLETETETTSLLFLPSYINICSVVFEILCGQTDTQTDKRRQKQYLLVACAQVLNLHDENDEDDENDAEKTTDSTGRRLYRLINHHIG